MTGTDLIASERAKWSEIRQKCAGNQHMEALFRELDLWQSSYSEAEIERSFLDKECRKLRRTILENQRDYVTEIRQMTEENRELTKLVENALSYRRETDDRLATMAKKMAEIHEQNESIFSINKWHRQQTLFLSHQVEEIEEKEEILHTVLLNIPENDELEKLKMEIGKLNQHRSELVARLTEIKQEKLTEQRRNKQLLGEINSLRAKLIQSKLNFGPTYAAQPPYSARPLLSMDDVIQAKENLAHRRQVTRLSFEAPGRRHSTFTPKEFLYFENQRGDDVTDSSNHNDQSDSRKLLDTV